MAYLDDLLVLTKPLPMDLNCQMPPRSGIEELKVLLAQATGTTPYMQPCGTPDPEEMTNPTTQQSKMVRPKCCCVIQ